MTIKENRTLRKIRAGDMEAFEALFHSFYAGMCSYAESLVKKQEIAEEVVQDVFYNIWKNKNELRITASWQKYLYRSVFNNSMMYLRKAKKEFSLDQEWASNTLESADKASQGVDEAELQNIIMYTLQQLPERTRTIFKMSRFEGLKYTDIADKLKISVKTVEANMGKALKALRTSLDEYRKTA